jgi:acetolactate synthase regulatory subunit
MQKNYWRIKCNHTPETVDRIMLSFRKRGQMVDSIHYKKISEDIATCEVEFEEEVENARRIYNNMIRLVDILEIEILETA